MDGSNLFESPVNFPYISKLNPLSLERSLTIGSGKSVFCLTENKMYDVLEMFFLKYL
jgi:hypothetical protein